MDPSESMRETAVACFGRTGLGGSLLNRLQWSRAVERDFFARGAEHLPLPEYDFDADQARSNLRELLDLLPRLEGDGALPRLLRRTTESYIASHRMLLSLGTRTFYELSLDQFGGASTMSLDEDTTNANLADHIAERLGLGRSSAASAGTAAGGARPPEGDLGETSPLLDHEAFVRALRRRVQGEHPTLDVAILVDPDVSAKVMAGMKRVRVREGASFLPTELESLYVHEIETHVLTAQNGQAQELLPFLRSGGPRATRTQEGLAVFSELYSRTLSIQRLQRLVKRVQLVAMAEDGASFLDVYRHLLRCELEPREAYLDCMRIFRGGLVGGGAPFTKDACYLSGLAEVYNFLRLYVREGTERVAEVLVSGRLALDDLSDLLELRSEGVLAPPRFRPGWLRQWDALVAYFGFTSFLNEIDLPPLRRRYAGVEQQVRALQPVG